MQLLGSMLLSEAPLSLEELSATMNITQNSTITALRDAKHLTPNLEETELRTKLFQQVQS